MTKTCIRAFCVLIAVIMTFSVFPAEAFAQEAAESGPTMKTVRLYFDGLLTGRAYSDGVNCFIPFSDMCTYFGISATNEYDTETDTVIAYGDGINLSYDTGTHYLTVNGRYLYLPEGIYYAGDELCFSAQITSRIFGISFGQLMNGRLNADTSSAALIRGGENYYPETFGEDNLFWLTKIIYSEAHTDPLEGLIAVGNVVQNRVASDIYPNSIYDVIYDTEFCVQFEPIISGTLYQEPDELSKIAACLCFEGYNLVGSCMYFVERYGFADDEWFKSTKTYYTTIGCHDFYD